VRPGDLFGDLGQGWIARPGILEPVFRYRDGVFVNALQWAIGLELFLRVQDPWRVFLTTDHPNGGPVFSGPQLQPWHCPDGATDAQCDQPPQFTYLYKSTDPSKVDLQPYDPANPPSDVASTTTDKGMTVPFVVRQELGYQDRDQYKILTLFTPGQAWSRWEPQAQWNHKLVITGGGGCGADHGAGTAPLNDFSGTIPSAPGYTQSYIAALGRGFAVMSTALDNTGHNCNLATEAESLIMAKERLIENYGDVRYTIGTGCSGGSVVQHTVANAYPGAVYDGLVVTCAYPDVLSAGAQFADYHLLRPYFENPARWGTGIVWPPVQWGLVEGRPDPVNAVVADEALFKSATNPVGSCVPAGQGYDPQANPGGVRCSILDAMINVLGPRPERVCSGDPGARPPPAPCDLQETPQREEEYPEGRAGERLAPELRYSTCSVFHDLPFLDAVLPIVAHGAGCGRAAVSSS